MSGLRAPITRPAYYLEDENEKAEVMAICKRYLGLPRQIGCSYPESLRLKRSDLTPPVREPGRVLTRPQARPPRAFSPKTPAQSFSPLASALAQRHSFDLGSDKNS
jgi:hypothetical protein